MQIGPVKETITITAGREEYNLSPAVNTVVDQQFVENLPLNGRSFQSLIQLTPGVVVTAASQQATSVSQIQLPPLAPSDFDIRHNFSAAVSYEIPAPSWRKVGHAIRKGWAVDGIVRASSSPPVNVRIAGTSTVLGQYFNQPDVYRASPFGSQPPGSQAAKS
jgi:hypothetical protein